MLRTLVLIAVLGRPAAAEPERPAVIVSAGIILPVFLQYERPGLWVGGAMLWRLGDHTRLVASADVGALVEPGSTRFTGAVGGGLRASPWRCARVWGQLGLGTTAFVERIGVVLPSRALRATTAGIALTADLAIGARLSRRWEIAFAYDQQLLTTEPGGTVFPGQADHETIPYIATVMLSVGRTL